MLLLLLNMTVFCMSSGALYIYIDVSTTEKSTEIIIYFSAYVLSSHRSDFSFRDNGFAYTNSPSHPGHFPDLPKVLCLVLALPSKYSSERE